MGEQRMAELVKDRVRNAARALGAADPLPYVGDLIERSFTLPAGDIKYGANSLTPGAVPFEPSFSEREPKVLRFTMEPLGPGPSPVARRDEATREMRRLLGTTFGRDALHWFDRHSEEWRGQSAAARLQYGAWFGTAYDKDGLSASKVYYELFPNQVDALPRDLGMLVRMATEMLPSLVPIFTSISCRRAHGSQRVTFLQLGPLRLKELEPLMARLGMADRLPGVMQVVGLALGGRFELPDRSVLIGLERTPRGPELKLEILLGMLPDLPDQFIELLALGLSERPRELRALARWIDAFTPDDRGWPGRFSVMSVRATAGAPARVNLYLRPVEFELDERFNAVVAQRPPDLALVP